MKEVVNCLAQVGAGPPGKRHGGRRCDGDQNANRDAAIHEIRNGLCGQEVQRNEQEQLESRTRTSRPQGRGQCGNP